MARRDAERAFRGVLDFQDASTRQFDKDLVRVARDLDRELVALASRLEVDAHGRFLDSENNVARMREIQLRLGKMVEEAGYPDAVGKLIGTYPELQKRVDKAWSEATSEKAGFLQEDMEAFRAMSGAHLDDFANVGQRAEQ
ncbi:MAG: hypothetical protein ACYTGV_13925, partial [Planctomycetota bacterium]